MGFEFSRSAKNSQSMIGFGVLLVVLAAISDVKAQTCPNLYKRYSTRHSFCLPANTQCTVKRTGVTSQERQLILRVHNELRSKIAMGLESRGGGMPRASNMMEMVWDDKLAEVAQKWSEQCDFNHDCGPCRKVEAFSVGQNLGLGYITAQGRGDWQRFLVALYDEVASRAFHTGIIDRYVGGPPPLHPDQYGHFTQLIWAESWKVGCGWTLFDMGQGQKSYLACNYGPSGNVLGKKIYEKGEPCTACPSNTCCGSSCSRNMAAKYDGLCKVINTRQPPVPIDNRQYLFYCDFLKPGDCAATKSNNLWNLVQTSGGNWQSVVLNGGQTTTLTFTKKFHSSGLACLRMYARGGPNVAGDQYGLNVKANFKLSRGASSSDLSDMFGNLDNDERQNFMHVTIGLSIFGEIQLGFEVSVPSGVPTQFFEIKKVTVTEPVGNTCPRLS